MAENVWTHERLKDLLEQGPITALENLIANPGRKYRPDIARTCAITALRNVAESDVLPEDIKALVLRVLKLYEQASDPFLGMNLSTESE